MKKPMLSRPGAAVVSAVNTAGLFGAVRLYTQSNCLWIGVAVLLLAADVWLISAMGKRQPAE